MLIGLPLRHVTVLQAELTLFLWVLLCQTSFKTSQQVFDWSASIELPQVDVELLIQNYEASMVLPDPYSSTGVPNSLNIIGYHQSGSEQYVVVVC